MISADVNKTLALTISFGRINGAQFWGALQERLVPLMMEVRVSCGAMLRACLGFSRRGVLVECPVLPVLSVGPSRYATNRSDAKSRSLL